MIYSFPRATTQQAFSNNRNDGNAANQQPLPKNKNGNHPTNSNSAGSFATDFGDDRKLVGYSQNVFAAKVVREISTVPRPFRGAANIQYEAEALYNIKGNVTGTVVVDLNVIQGGSLTPGTTYLFAAKHLEELSPWYFIGFIPQMMTIVSEDSTLTDDQLTDAVLKNTRTYELLSAYPNEILFANDVARNDTQNSFQSLSDVEKQAVRDRIAALPTATSTGN